MKRLLVIAILGVAALAAGGCTFAYEQAHYHRRPHVIHRPPVRVIEVVPAYPPRHRRPGRYRYHRY